MQGVTTSAVAPFWGILADRGIMKRLAVLTCAEQRDASSPSSWDRKHIIVMGCVLQGLVTMLLSVIDSKLDGTSEQNTFRNYSDLTLSYMMAPHHQDVT